MDFLKGVTMNKIFFLCAVVAGFMCGTLCASQDFFGKACEIDDKNATLEVPMKFKNHINQNKMK